jgi:hypothetical protein
MGQLVRCEFWGLLKNVTHLACPQRKEKYVWHAGFLKSAASTRFSYVAWHPVWAGKGALWWPAGRHAIIIWEKSERCPFPLQIRVLWPSRACWGTVLEIVKGHTMSTASLSRPISFLITSLKHLDNFKFTKNF